MLKRINFYTVGANFSKQFISSVIFMYSYLCSVLRERDIKTVILSFVLFRRKMFLLSVRIFRIEYCKKETLGQPRVRVKSV